MNFGDDDKSYRPSVETMAHSAFNAYRVACLGKEGVGGTANEFKGLHEDLQERWWNLAYKAEQIFESHDNRPIADVTGAIYKAFCREDLNDLPAWERTAWEAVTKHMWKMLDAEDQNELEPLAGLENSWGAWAARRHPEGSVK